MRVITRTSAWAVWSRRFASLALPLSILPVWMHRNQILSSDAFQIILITAIMLAVLAILSGIAAYIRVWQTGDQGWGRASLGIFIGLLCLSPFAYGAIKGMSYPLVNDVSTDMSKPLDMVVKSPSSQSRGENSEADVASVFPGIFSRYYELTPLQVFSLAENLVLARNWDILARHAPGNAGREGKLNAMAMTFMGWRDEVALRVVLSGAGTQVDMRSASLNGMGDLGVNGKRIESFLSDLDELVAREIDNAQ